MKNEFIDLGCGLDSTAVTPSPPSESKKSYPCFYFTCDEKIDLPKDEFTFMAKGRKVEDSENSRDPENPRYRYEIEVHGFKPVGGDKEPASVSETLKKNIREKMKARAYEREMGDE